jgi:sodium transport system permease protein
VKLSNILIVYRKELTDMLRDRRTIFGMVVFPLLIFPVITVGFNRLEQRMTEKVKKELAPIVLLGAEHAPALAGKLRAAEGLQVLPDSSNYAARINGKTLRAAVEFPAGFEQALAADAKEPPQVKVYFQAAEVRSDAAADRIEEIINEYRRDVVAQRLSVQGLSEAFVKPVETRQENVASEQKVSGRRLGIIVPYFMIFLCLMGAMHPAMDLTAGEKERGTLETILASSVHRGELVLGKFFLVLTASLTTTAMSMLSYGFTLARFGGSQAPAAGKFTLTVPAALSILAMLIPLAVLFSSCLIAVSLLAKGYKEAQSYTSPLVTIVVLPAVFAMLPGVELNFALALVPIINVSLVVREVLTGSFPFGYMAATFASTLALAGIALHTAYDMFQREEVLFRT